MREIPLTQDLVALVDDEDYERVAHHKWCALAKGRLRYAVRHVAAGVGRQRLVYMHRDVLGFVSGDPDVDHRDGNGLNNQRTNLRAADDRQNQRNVRKHARPCTSAFKGVYWDKTAHAWRARVSTGKCSARGNALRIHVGHFESEEAAARAYDVAARERYGEFAKLNFP